MARTLSSRRTPRQQAAHRNGAWAEKIALLYLLCKGYKPISRGNFSRGVAPRALAQTDLLLRHRHHLVLVEVKFRRTTLAASHALSPAQAIRLRREALAVLRRHGQGHTVRIDAVWLIPRWPFIRHLPNAVPLN